MDFEWDEAKRVANLEKHAIDFLRATQLFDGRPVITCSSPRGDELRFITIGAVEEEIVAVVWTERDSIKRLISARKARNAEKRAYRSVFG